MTFYLLEVYSRELELEANSIVVALTPFACYQLEKAGIRYVPIDDYYDEHDIIKGEQEYYDDQLVWFSKFDDFLCQLFPEAKAKNLKLATTWYLYIKNMMDAVILRSKIIDNFLIKARPKTIRYFSEKWPEETIGLSEYPLLFRKCRSLFSRLIPLFCEKYNIEFRHSIVEDIPRLSSQEDRQARSVLSSIKRVVKDNEFIRTLWYSYKTFDIRSAIHYSSEQQKYNILFLERNRVVSGIMKDAIKEGYGIFYKRGKEIIIQQTTLWPKVVGRIHLDSTAAAQTLDREFPICTESNIMKWINGYCGIDVSSIVMPRLHYFINTFCRQFLVLLDKYITFYNEHHIRLVITLHMTEVEEFAAIAATRLSRNTKSVCLQHGDDVFDIKMWDLYEYRPFDIYFTNSDDREAYIKNRVALGNYGTQVYQYRELFESMSRLGHRRDIQRIITLKKTVAYVPAMYQWDNTNWRELRLPDLWYFRWQKELLTVFRSRRDFNFIWKAFPSNETYDPLQQMIKDGNVNNVTYSNDYFPDVLPKVDLVLMDFPSTALYEAVLSGMPVLSLYYKPFTPVRKSAQEVFGKSLEPFSDFGEGIRKVNAFLDADPEGFIVAIRPSERSFVESLQSAGILKDKV